MSTETFHNLDHHVWTILWKWALFRYPKKPRRWVVDRYFGQFHPTRRDRWVFGNRDSGAYLPRFGWTKIVRHDLVKGAASPDDPALAGYWEARRRRGTPSLINRILLRQLRRQHGRCPICAGLLLHADRQPDSPQEWEQWLRAVHQGDHQESGRPHRTDPDERSGTASPAHRLLGPDMPAPTAALHLCPPMTHRACLSRVPGNWPARF